MAILRLLAFLFLLATLPFLTRTDEGPYVDPNGRPSNIDGGGAMDPNGYTICVDPNG